MKPTTRAGALSIVTLALVAAAAPFASELTAVFFRVVPVTFVVTGTWLATRRPSNSIGWIFLCSALLFAVAGLGDAFAQNREPGWAQTSARIVFASAFFPGLALVTVPLLVLFPTGRPPSPRWRPVLWLAAAYAAFAVSGNLLSVGSALAIALQNAAAVALLLGMAGGVAALVVRFRRGGTVERAQLKWFLLAAALLPVAIVLSESFPQHPQVQELMVSLGLVPLPVAVTVAVLRYRLYEIDRLVSRTITYALVTAVVGGVYGLIAVLPSTAFDLESDLLVALATLAAAAVFRPVLRRVQAAVDRRFNRQRYDAVRVARQLADRLRSDVELDSVATDLRAAVRGAVQPAGVSVWVRPAARNGLRHASGTLNT